MRKLLISLLVLLLMTSTAFASTVTYQDSAEDFVFSPGSTYSPTDLFSDFKNVMPGDSITQTIVVKNSETADNVTIKLYLRALGAQDGSEEFLSQMKLTVKGPDDTLFEAPPSETARLTDWVYLGSVQSGGEIPLQLTLNVPITMGNEFQQQIGYLDWQFKAERIESAPAQEDPPSDQGETSGSGTQTGDESNLLPLYGICGLAVLIMIVGRNKSQRHRRNCN